MPQSACRRKEGGRSSGDPVFSHVCAHGMSWMPSKSFWWTVFFTLGLVSGFVTPTDVHEEKAEGESGWYALCLKHIPKNCIWKCLQLQPLYYLVVAEAGFPALLQDHPQTCLLRLNAPWWELCRVRERTNFNSPLSLKIMWSLSLKILILELHLASSKCFLKA